MRRATVRTSHDDPETVTGAVRPDNTTEMATTVRGGLVVTTVERETTAGLASTVDDYVVNLRVADRAASRGGASRDAPVDGADRTGDGSDLGEQPDDRPNEDGPKDDPNHE